MALLLLGSVVLLGLALDTDLHARAVAAGWAPAESPWLGAAILFGGIGLWLAAHAFAGRRALRTLGTGFGGPRTPGRRWLALHDRLAAAAPPVLLGVFGLALAAGWADLVRAAVGNAWLLDDLLALAPVVLATVLLDASSWPLVRRFREAVLFRRADAGLPIHPVPPRWAYALGRFRSAPAMLGVPLLLILGWTQALDAVLDAAHAGSLPDVFLLSWLPAPGTGGAAALGMAGSLAAVALCPPLLVRALPTAPMPAGPLRDELLAFLKTERVRVRPRGLRLWLSGGTLANAALVGVLPPLRYLLLSDHLVESLRRHELLAVLAHETGHAVHRHLLWLGACAGALAAVLLLGLDALAAAGLLGSASGAGGALTESEMAAMAAAALAFLGGFGWVSRRIEAQADAHAAAAMSAVLAGDPEPGQAEGQMQQRVGPPPRYTAAGVEAVRSALAEVCSLAGARESGRSYRHGSIASRRTALLRLLLDPDRPSPADRSMTQVKWAVLASVPVAAGLWWLA